MKNKIHIVPHDGEWAIRVSGCEEPVATEATQQAAIELAMGVAADEKMDVVVHRRDGSFRKFIHLENIERRQDAAAEAAKGDHWYSGRSGRNLAWGIFAVGAVTGLAVYLALNPPREAQRLISKLDKQRPDWLRF